MAYSLKWKICKTVTSSLAPLLNQVHTKGHSTGFNYPGEKGFQFHIEDGVQCEQCHGAGSEYIRLNTMKMLSRDELDPETVGHITPEKELCMTCHEEKHKHILPFKEEERFKKIAH